MLIYPWDNENVQGRGEEKKERKKKEEKINQLGKSQKGTERNSRPSVDQSKLGKSQTRSPSGVGRGFPVGAKGRGKGGEQGSGSGKGEGYLIFV